MSGELVQRDLTPEEFFGLAVRKPSAIVPRVVDPAARIVDVKVVENKRIDPILKQIDNLSLAFFELKYHLEKDGPVSAHMMAVGIHAQVNVLIKELSKRSKARRR